MDLFAAIPVSILNADSVSENAPVADAAVISLGVKIKNLEGGSHIGENVLDGNLLYFVLSVFKAGLADVKKARISEISQ